MAIKYVGDGSRNGSSKAPPDSSANIESAKTHQPGKAQNEPMPHASCGRVYAPPLNVPPPNTSQRGKKA